MHELPLICEALGPSFNEAAVGLTHEALLELDEFLLITAIECIERLLRNEVFKDLSADIDLRPFDLLLFHPAVDVRRSMLRMLTAAEDISRTGYVNIWGQHAIDALAPILGAVSE